MTTLVYDASFEGLLTAIFEVYACKLAEVTIYREGQAGTSLFGENRVLETDAAKAKRVYAGLKEKLTPGALTQFYKTYLSELPLIENSLLRYVQYVYASSKSVETDYRHPDVLLLQQTSRQVEKEKHRMEAFVRFQLTGDGLYYSMIQPDFNVLPLISKHFSDRYADQRWLIYDLRRKYGLHYDLEKVEPVTLDFDVDVNNKQQLSVINNEKEELYQQLWRQYFTSVNIPARKNMKLHIRMMPKRYWRHMLEKQPAGNR